MGNALQQRLSLLSGLEAGLPVGADFVAEVGDLRSVGTEGAAGSLDSMYGAFHRVLLLTAQRREEVAGVRWSELDLEKGTWLIPKERTKNGKGHLVHLSPQALACLPVKGVCVSIAGARDQHIGLLESQGTPRRQHEPRETLARA